MNRYMNGSILQLVEVAEKDALVKTGPIISYFDRVYIPIGLFYKDDYLLEAIQIKWNEFYYFKIQRDVELLGPMWLKVSIPYFQIIENITKTTTVITNTGNINEIIYDNHDTFLVIVDSIYYLIPIIFLQSPGIKYYLTETTFNDIKQFFNNIAIVNIPGDTTIMLFVYTPDQYNNHLIPFLLNQGNSFDKLMLSIISNNKNVYRKNLLTQNSFDLYTENQINSILISNFITINKYDSLYNIYSIMVPEVEYYYDYHLNNITSSSINYDLYQAYNYSLNASLSISTDQLLYDTVTLNSLVLQFFLLNINPSIYNTYNFYKKFSTTVYPYPVLYSFSLLESDIINTSTLVGLSINLINTFYPKYTVNINAINSRLPFTLTVNMPITTKEGYTLVYTVENNANIFTISDTNKINLEELPLLIQIGYTENIVDNTIINSDSNINTEWASNLVRSLDNLKHHTNIQNYLFDDFQKNYILKENIIKNNFAVFNEANDIITTLWIELNTILTQYNKKNTDIGFNTTTNKFVDTFNKIKLDYNNLVNIQSIPQDLTFTYAICINFFLENCINKYFYDDTFLVFFYNKINSFIYQRYNRISNFLQTNTSTFIGLLFYYNIELREYLTKLQINNYMTELFYMKSIICYIDCKLNTPLTLIPNNIVNYTDSTKIGGVENCFHELRLDTSYNLTNKSIILGQNTITIASSVFNNIYNIDGLALYTLNIDNVEYIASYSNTSDSIVLTTSTVLPTTYSTIFLNETIIKMIPLIDVSENTTLNNIEVVSVLDTNQQINLFEEYNKVNVKINENAIVIVSYQSNKIVVASYDSVNGILVSDKLDKNYLLYTKIDLTIVKLSLTNITIHNSDCTQDITSTYPYVELSKLSNVYTSNVYLFTQLNTIKSGNKDVRISSQTDSTLYLYFNDADVFNGSSVDINIMDNSTLPNLFNYTSLNTDISNLMDYMIQKPYMIQLKSSVGAPVYCMANIPSYSFDTVMYLDNIMVNDIYQLNSNQLIRDSIRLYASHYYKGLLLNVNDIPTIESTIQSLYNSSYNGIYTDIVNLIESSQDTYFQSMNEMLNIIQNTDTYGITITSLYEQILPLNKMKYSSNISSYLLNPTRYDIVNYDVYTNLAIGLYNMKTVNDQSITINNTLITILSDRYNSSTKQLINSPWQIYDPSFKLSQKLISTLSNYATYGSRLLSFVDKNTTMLQITNYTNFPQNFSKEYMMRSKYTELVYNVPRVDIELMYPNPWDQSLIDNISVNDISVNDISVKWMKDTTTINVDTNGILYGDTIELYKDKPIYDTMKLNQVPTFDLIGAIQIKDKMIVLDSSLDPNLKYIVIDNKTIIDISKGSLTDHGINYNSYGLILGEMNTVDFYKLGSPLYYYQIEQSNLEDIFEVDTNYIIRINNIKGYLTYTGDYLVVLLENKHIITENTLMFYNETPLNDSDLFNYIFNEDNNDILLNQYTFINIKITASSCYNYYNVIPAISDFVIFNMNHIVPQYYNDSIFLLGITLINYYDNMSISTLVSKYSPLIFDEVDLSHTNNLITLDLYSSQIFSLPPLVIDRYNVSIFNPLSNINWLDNKNNWLSIDNIICTVGDMDQLLQDSNISDGNYLLYYSNSLIKPTIYKHPDIFYDSVEYNNSEFNPYKNVFTLMGNITTSSFNPANYVANNNLIQNIIEVSDTMNVLLYPQNQNIRTTIIFEQDNTMYNRPLIITNEEVVMEYILYNEMNDICDSYIIIDINSTTEDPIFVRRLNFIENITLTCTSNLVSIEYVSPSEYNIYVINSLNITSNIDHMIVISIQGSGTLIENIYLWLYIGKCPSINLITSNNVINEPYYINYNTQQSIYFDNDTVNIISIDTTLFTLVDSTIYTITNNIIPLTIKNSSYLNYNDMVQIEKNPCIINSTFNSIYQENKNIINRLNAWVYIDNVSITDKVIQSTTLAQFSNYIFINNDMMYFNLKENETNGTIYLAEPISITSGDVYVYPYEPIFITCQLSCAKVNSTIYLYTNTHLLQRNEIIKIGKMMLVINQWSHNSNSYIGTILNMVSPIPNIITGYYSYGIWSNYHERTVLLNCNTNNSLLYGVDNTINQLIVGDYYIDSNIMKMYEGEITSNYIFKFTTGTYIPLYKINNKWYYDDLKYTIEPRMQLIYLDDGIIRLIVREVDGNIIKFYSDTITKDSIICYLANQPFTEINTLDFNGWIEVDNAIYNANDYVVDSENIRRIFDLDKMVLRDDFNNYYNVSTLVENTNNDKIPLSIICNINLDEEYVYFTQTSATILNFTNLNYCYYQYILVSSNHYRLINITSDRVYINLLSNDVKNTLPSYQIIFSAGNINNRIITSNGYVLHGCYTLDYPIIRNTNNAKLVRLLSSEVNNISNVFDDVSTYNNTIVSEQLNQSIYINMTTNYFYENYIPINISDSLVLNQEKSFTQDTLTINSGNYILLQEITSEGPIYQHYINITISNNMLKISSNNNFHNINTSIFYLHNIIQVIITKNNYILLNNSNYTILRPINTLQRNTLTAIVYISTNIIDKPIKVKNNWKYMINFDAKKYQMIQNFNRTLYYNDDIKCSIIFDSQYYIVTPSIIDTLTSVYFYETEYIESTQIITKNIKPEYTTFESSVFNNISHEYPIPLKLVNRVNIMDNNLFYTTTIIDNSNNNATFGVIDGTTYLGDSNIVNSISIVNNTYQITSTYKLLDLTSNSLYNMCKDFYSNQYIINKYIINKHIINKPELSTSLPSLETYLNDEGITFNYIASIVRPWREWSFITMRYNDNLISYLNDMNIVYDGVSFSTSKYSQYTSYFTTNETTTIKNTLITFYQDGILEQYKIDILYELYKVEIYLMNEINLYLSQDYFWKNISSIITELLQNYIGNYKWTLYNNTIMIIQNNVLEKDLYPSNFILNGSTLIRTNYFSSDIDIYVLGNTMNISRDPSIIDRLFNNIINLNWIDGISIDGISMDSFIAELNTLSVYKSNIITTQPLFYQYMDSLVYYIAKMYQNYMNTTKVFKLAKLTNLDSTIINYTPNITGKYYDYLFNEKYFGLQSQTKYSVLTQPAINTMYIDPSEVGNLITFTIDENSINRIVPNNVFSYFLNFNDMMLQSPELELIKCTNTYTIDILNNYQHLDNITVDLTRTTIDSLAFFSNQIIEPIDVSVITQEEYTITSTNNYGTMYQVILDGTITKDDKISYNNTYILYIESISQNIQPMNQMSLFASNDTVESIPGSTYNIASLSIDLSVCNVMNVSLDVAIKNKYISNNNTYLVLSNNITPDFNYIEINNTIYQLYYDTTGYYIDSNIDLVINRIYTALRFIKILSQFNTNISVSDIYVDHDINPIDYNVLDPLLQRSFSSENLTIQTINILTPTSLRVFYSGTIDQTITHTYNFKQSIPYRIKSITSESKYFYTMNNINSVRLNDTIIIYDMNLAADNSRVMSNYNSLDSSYNVNIYSIGTTIKFSITSYLQPSVLNNMTLLIIKNYPLTVISINNYQVITSIPSDFTDYYNYVYYIVIDGTRYLVAIDIINRSNPEFSITVPVLLDPTTEYNISLDQELTTTTSTINNTNFNTLYRVSTVLDSTVSNISNFNQPIIQILDSSMKKFNAMNYYHFDNNMPFIVDYSELYIVDNDNYIDAIVVLVQTNQIIVGTNITIEPKRLKIYSSDFKYSEIVNLQLSSYVFQKGELLEQISPNEYMMLFSYNSLEEYNIANNLGNNNIIMSFKYSDITFTNNSYPMVGFNKVPDVSTTQTSNTTSYNDVVWVDNFATKLFSSIQLTIDDTIIESLDHDTYTIYTNYIVDNWKRDEFNKMTQLRYDTNNNLFFFLPIVSSFTMEPSSYLPISKMNRSNVQIKFNISRITDMILNLGNGFTKNVNPIIDVHYDYIITSVKKTPLIAEYKLYKILYSYQNFILNNLEEYNHINLYNRTSDLFLITTLNGVNTYIVSDGYDRDIWYSEYLENSIIDIDIFELIDSEINIKSPRYIVYSENKIISSYDVRFAMYLDEKYLQYIDETITSGLKYSQKISILILYFTKIYRNNNITLSTDIINSINIQVDGHELLPILPAQYNNNVIPYLKGNRLPNGYYMYSFSLDSLAKQPNGMLNLKNVKDLQIYTLLNLANQGVKLKICTSEYRILKIENNVGRLD